ncbi:MAG: Zn-dependent peptidase ImmA (M78 family) [Candidatus Azotimanducaceae bacterium]|jgi:Zn-dependent peptidase ImmA (M78 family)
MANRVELSPDLIRWARQRSGLAVDALSKKFPKFEAWEAGEVAPTLKQLESYAHYTHTPLGYFFLEQPPEESLPIPDFRTVGDDGLRRPSPDLLETIETMQRRQDWLREYLIDEGAEPLPFVGSADLQASPDTVAQAMREALGLSEGWASVEKSWTDALQHLRERIDELGVLVVINGVVGNSTRRKLQVQEFRGFALSDAHSPLIFINGSDAKAAQMFTLIHELAHIWLGADGVSNFEALQPADIDVELFCNKVAAEFLVPTRKLHAVWAEASRAEEPFQRLARQFKVSPLVAARRAMDLGLVEKADFFSFYGSYQKDERRKQGLRRGGGDFWNTQNTRIGRRFGATVVRATREGKLLYRDAYRLTGLQGKTFDSFAERLGFRKA